MPIPTATIRLGLLLLGAMASAVPLAAQSTDSLYAGASVRVKVAKLSPDWITGTVVTMQRTATCLAIKLDRTDAQGRALFAFFTSVSALEVDPRTNQGYMLAGRPDPTTAPWVAWPAEQIAIIGKRCQR